MGAARRPPSAPSSPPARATARAAGATRKPLRQHRLAGTWRPDEQHVVPARGRDLERQAGRRLPADLHEVRDRCLVGRRRRQLDVGPRCTTAQHLDQVAESVDAPHLSQRRHPRLVDARNRHDGVDGAEHPDHRRNTRHRPDRAVEPELAHERQSPHRLRQDVLARDQQAHGDRQIETRPRLAMTRRGEIDGDPLRRRPSDAAAHERRAHPVARLAARFIGETDDGEGGQTDADVDLDGDGMTLRSEDRGGLDGGGHGNLLRSQRGAAAGDRRDGGPVRRRVPIIVPPGCDRYPVPHSSGAPPIASRGRDRGHHRDDGRGDPRRMQLRGRRQRRPAFLCRRCRRCSGDRRRRRSPRRTSTRRSTSTATWRTRRRSRSKTRWRDLLLNVETASTVVPEDPESVQRTVAVAFATEKSAVAVRNWVLTNCGVDLGPVATIAPQDPAATTTLPPDISTTLVTVVPPPTVPPPTVPTATLVAEVPTTTLPAEVPPPDVPPATGAAG